MTTRDIRKAITSTRSAVVAGDFTRARNAARYAIRRLGVPVPPPASDDLGVWTMVLCALDGYVEALELKTQAARVVGVV